MANRVTQCRLVPEWVCEQCSLAAVRLCGQLVFCFAMCNVCEGEQRMTCADFCWLYITITLPLFTVARLEYGEAAGQVPHVCLRTCSPHRYLCAGLAGC